MKFLTAVAAILVWILLSSMRGLTVLEMYWFFAKLPDMQTTPATAHFAVCAAMLVGCMLLGEVEVELWNELRPDSRKEWDT